VNAWVPCIQSVDRCLREPSCPETSHSTCDGIHSTAPRNEPEAKNEVRNEVREEMGDKSYCDGTHGVDGLLVGSPSAIKGAAAAAGAVTETTGKSDCRDDMYDRATEAICRFALGGLLQAVACSAGGQSQSCGVESCGSGGAGGDDTMKNRRDKKNISDGYSGVGRICAEEGWFTPSSSTADSEKVECNRVDDGGACNGASGGGNSSSQLDELIDHELNREYVLHTIREIIVKEGEVRGRFGKRVCGSTTTGESDKKNQNGKL
jgi:hypothetical protein